MANYDRRIEAMWPDKDGPEGWMECQLECGHLTILGHASQKMTQRYTHAELERVRPAMETASEGIGEALRKPAAKVLVIRKARKAG